MSFMCQLIGLNSPGGLAYDLVLKRSAGFAIADPIIPAIAPDANFFQIGDPFWSAPMKVFIGS